MTVRLTPEDLLRSVPQPAVLFSTPSVRDAVARALPLPQISSLDAVGADTRTLVVAGGGTLLDAAKVFRWQVRPDLCLVAVPTLWGSGAENSPVAVAMADGKKQIRMDAQLMPDFRLELPELAASIPLGRARHACGDAWSHALEGFLSPLADAALHQELAALMAEMLQAKLSNDPVWFDLSARACAGQARASVGLIHGIAHVLEGPLQAAGVEPPFGHAELCAVYLWPVLSLNVALNHKWLDLAQQFGIDRPAVERTLQDLADPARYRLTLPAMQAQWPVVLRDRCTRTNSALIRPPHLQHFLATEFA